MSEKLKPCPKCGSDAVKLDYRWDSITLSKHYFVCCVNCDTYFYGNYSEDSTIARWNIRPAEDALKAEVEKLKVELAARESALKIAHNDIKWLYEGVEKWKKMFYDLDDKYAKVLTEIRRSEVKNE